MYYYYKREITMHHVTKYLDVPFIQKAIDEMVLQQSELTRKKQVLRTRIHRLKKLIDSHNQLELPISED